MPEGKTNCDCATFFLGFFVCPGFKNIQYRKVCDIPRQYAYPERGKVFQISNISAMVLNWFIFMLCKTHKENR